MLVIGDQLDRDLGVSEGGPKDAGFPMMESHRVPGVGHPREATVQRFGRLREVGSGVPDVEPDAALRGKIAKPRGKPWGDLFRGDRQDPKGALTFPPEALELPAFEGAKDFRCVRSTGRGGEERTFQMNAKEAAAGGMGSFTRCFSFFSRTFLLLPHPGSQSGDCLPQGVGVQGEEGGADSGKSAACQCFKETAPSLIESRRDAEVDSEGAVEVEVDQTRGLEGLDSGKSLDGSR